MKIVNTSVFEEGLNRFNDLTKKPENFLGVQEEVGKELKFLLKDLYDYTKRCEESSGKSGSGALPELVVKLFDEEQIWQELELQNDEKCNKFISDVSRLVARKDSLNFLVKPRDGDDSRNEKKSMDYTNSESDLESASGSEVQMSDRPEMDRRDASGDDLELNDENDDKIVQQRDELENTSHRTKTKGSVRSKPSVVDDRFFKLRDLERYLVREDKKENLSQKTSVSGIGRKGGNDHEDDDEEESIDYFEDIPSDEEEEEGDEGVDALYKDFFDPPEEDNVDEAQNRLDVSSNKEDEEVESGEEYDEEEEQAEETRELDEKQVRFNLSPASGSSGSEDEEQPGNKSNFEARQERLKARIKHLEEEALAEKPWQLKGEISATGRPQNSLLEEIVEFDLTTRPAPIITEQTTVKLEDIILQRIKDKAWDDVERKVKPVKEPNEYKKQLVMDQEKSKLSLAEVYEQEYIKQREAQDPSNQDKPEEEPKEHQEIRAMTSALFAKLDALSNFHYTPKPVVPEIRVISNLPAISMEEVAPVATSEAALLAPEEVKAKPKGDVIGKTERTKTDKRRERRHKKTLQRQRQRERENREKVVEKLRPGLGNKYSKERALQMLEKVTKDKNVEQMEDAGKDKGVRSSTAFFARLQEEVTGHIKARTESDKRKKTKNNISAKRMKL